MWESHDGQSLRMARLGIKKLSASAASGSARGA